MEYIQKQTVEQNKRRTFFEDQNVTTFETAKNNINSVTLKNSAEDFWKKENAQYSQQPKSGFESQDDKYNYLKKNK